MGTPIHRTYSDDMFTTLLESDAKTKLNLGCATDRIDGWINLDIEPNVRPTIAATVYKLPFKDNSIDHVLASHLLEHLYDIPSVKNEIHRVLKENGTFVFIVPEYTSPDAWGCDTHVRAFSLHTFIEENWIGWRPILRQLLTVPSRDGEELKWLYGKYSKETICD